MMNCTDIMLLAVLLPLGIWLLCLLISYIYFVWKSVITTPISDSDIPIPSWLNFDASQITLPNKTAGGSWPENSMIVGRADGFPSDLCLTASQIKNGAQLQSWPCTNAPNQKFTYDDSSQSLKVNGTDLCIDSHKNQNGQILTTHNCNNSDPQKWYIDNDNTIKYNGTNRCINIRNAANPVKSPIEMTECDGRTTMKWQSKNDASSVAMPPAFPSKSLIRYGANTNSCWEFSADKKGNFSNGVKLHVAPCNNGNKGQLFNYNADNSSLVLDAAGKCVDLHSTKNGSAIQLWGCNNTSAQKWLPSSDGTIRYDSAKQCADLHGGSTSNGNPVNIYDCYSTPNQVWKWS